MTENQTKTKPKAKAAVRRILRNPLPTLLLGVAAVLLVVGSLQLVLEHTATTGTADLPQPNEVVVEDTPKPDEEKTDYSSYSVPADQPRLITIPRIESIGPIQKVGITETGAMAVPTNVHFAGWYVEGVKPGENGLSIIDGHVSGKYSPGIFKHLGELEEGDEVVVEYGDGSLRHFKVVETKTLPESESAAFLFTEHDDIESQLNLITCGGKFNSSTSTFDQRVIVVTKLVS